LHSTAAIKNTTSLAAMRRTPSWKTLGSTNMCIHQQRCNATCSSRLYHYPSRPPCPDILCTANAGRFNTVQCGQVPYTFSSQHCLVHQQHFLPPPELESLCPNISLPFTPHIGHQQYTCCPASRNPPIKLAPRREGLMKKKMHADANTKRAPESRHPHQTTHATSICQGPV